MNRHVIKGRGEHRGQYLSYARMAGLPAEDRHVWLPEQRKAMRCKDPRYSGQTYETWLAREHDGYFVKLVAGATVTDDLVQGARTFIREHAAGADEPLACYWFSSDFHDAGEDFCRDCAEKLVDEKYAADQKRFNELYGTCETAEERYRAAIDGGFDTEHDSPPYCETCGAKLSGNLTEYGADEEIDALTAFAAPAFNCRYGWASLDAAIVNLSDDDPRWRKVLKVVEAAKVAEQRAEEAAAKLAASPGMPEARGAFVDLLGARAEQKAPEPSYRLWAEFIEWHRLPYEARRAPDAAMKALVRRLIKEASLFVAALGLAWQGDCVEAPYGTYYWPFIVRIEQYRLWLPKPYVEGRAYMLNPCPSGDLDWPHHRDANPYPEGAEEHEQWDAGYVGASEEKRA